ncbi:translin [Planococcus citri]|uniref:translin n=1 Tax=Planococcus citri TaxID=170843 RepID=UPI0031F765C2
METIMQVFTDFQENLDREQNTREVIKNTTKEIEENSRKIITLLQVIHQEEGSQQIPVACAKCKSILEDDVKPAYIQLSMQIEKGMYYKYNDYWKIASQKLCFSIALINYLEKTVLISHEEVASVLGLAVNEKEGFHLPIEDYLFGLLALVSELSRYAVNAVTNGDYEKPMQISHFVSEINAGFRLLNLKNDALRKRYDVLKYDVKKIEEVVYDLSIRGLKTPNTEGKN